METKKDYVNRVYREAMARGLCRRQKEFAALLGMDQSTISSALKGNEKYLTESIVRRVRAWEEQVLGRKEEEPKPEVQRQPDIVIPAATATLYNNMSETIRIQAEIIARLQGSTSPAYTQKNYLRDGK